MDRRPQIRSGRPGTAPRLQPGAFLGIWAAADTSGRAYRASGNRFNEYCNSGPCVGASLLDGAMEPIRLSA
jgi:hypothetical protein